TPEKGGDRNAKQLVRPLWTANPLPVQRDKRASSSLNSRYSLEGKIPVLAEPIHLDVKRRIQSETFTEWALRFKQFSLHPAIRVLPSRPLGTFRTSRFSGHAAFPLEFPRQVSPVTQRYHAQPFPCCTGINNVVTRRTVAGLLQRLFGLLH